MLFRSSTGSPTRAIIAPGLQSKLSKRNITERRQKLATQRTVNRLPSSIYLVPHCCNLCPAKDHALEVFLKPGLFFTASKVWGTKFNRAIELTLVHPNLHRGGNRLDHLAGVAE